MTPGAARRTLGREAKGSAPHIRRGDGCRAHHPASSQTIITTQRVYGAHTGVRVLSVLGFPPTSWAYSRVRGRMWSPGQAMPVTSGSQLVDLASSILFDLLRLSASSLCELYTPWRVTFPQVL